MAKLYKSSRTTRKAAHFASLTSGPDIDLNVHECPHTPSPASSTSSGPFNRLFNKPEGGCGCLSNARSPDMVVMTMYQLQDKLKSIALKISLYPIALIVINTIVTSTCASVPLTMLIVSRGCVYCCYAWCAHRSGVCLGCYTSSAVWWSRDNSWSSRSLSREAELC